MPVPQQLLDASERYVQALARLDPNYASDNGLPQDWATMSDYSPEGFARIANLASQALLEISRIAVEDPAGQLAKQSNLSFVRSVLKLHETGNHYYLNSSWWPGAMIQEAFDNIPKKTSSDWTAVLMRLEELPLALRLFESTLAEGLNLGHQSAPRQVAECVEQCEEWGSGESFVHDLVGEAPKELQEAFGHAADRAAAAYKALGSYLKTSYAFTVRNAPDAASPDRYQANAAAVLGMKIDPVSTYRSLWERYWDLTDQIDPHIALHWSEVFEANTLYEGATPLRRVLDLLSKNEEFVVRGKVAMANHLRNFMANAAQATEGVLVTRPRGYDKPNAVMKTDAAGSAPYFVPAYKAAGTMYMPCESDDATFNTALMGVVTYHEGSPGHLDQAAIAVTSEFPTTEVQKAIYFSGHGEGVAMAIGETQVYKLGLLSTPEQTLDYLTSQRMRVLRAINDLALHHGYSKLDRNGRSSGPVMTPEVAETFFYDNDYRSQGFARNQVTRVLGWPGQALCYVIGEDVVARELNLAVTKLGMTRLEANMAFLQLGAMPLELVPGVIERVAVPELSRAAAVQPRGLGD